MRRSTAWLLIGLSVAASCSSDGAAQPGPPTVATVAGDTSAADSELPATSSASSASSPPPVPEETATTVAAEPAGPTPWSEAVDAFDPETAPDVNAALTLFSLAFGPIAGLPDPPASTGAEGDVTLAYRAVLRVWDQLTPEQRDSVTAALTLSPDSSATRVIGVIRPAIRPATPPDQKLVDAIASTAKELRGSIASKIGDFTGKLTVVVATKDDADKDLGYAVPGQSGAGALTGDCTVTILPRASSNGAERLINTIAHEVFHCFQFAGAGSLAALAGAPGWVTEGGAEWAAATITVADDTTAGRWKGYLTRPEAPLQIRKYDGLGFWAHLAESGVDPWTVFRTVWAAAGTPAAFAASGAATPAFLDSWASGFSRDPGRGPAWDTNGPYITADEALPKLLSVPRQGQVSASAVPYANSLSLIETDADVLVFSATGNARMSDGTIDTAELGAARFCRRPDGCTCPNVPDDIPPAPLGGQPVLAVTGGPSGSSVIVGGLTLQLHCEEREKRPVQVVVDRPASEGLLAGRVLELTSCNGAYGDWSGVVRLGGISLNGFEVPFQDLPVSFTVGGTGAMTVPVAIAGNISTPAFNLAVAYDLSVTVDGVTMSITGTGSGDTGLIAVEQVFPGELTGLPIQPAPDGICPAP